MSGILWGLGVFALIMAGDAAMVGLHYWTLAHPPTRTRAVSSVLPNAPARVRAQRPAGAPGDRSPTR